MPLQIVRIVIRAPSVEAGIETYGCCLNNYLTDPLARCIFRLDRELSIPCER